MISWLTPYLGWVKIAVVVGVGLAGYYLGGLAPERTLSDLRASLAEATQQATQANLERDQKAEDLKDAELKSLPVPSRVPVYILRNAAACPVPVSAEAGGTTAASGRADQGSGDNRQPVDIRPQINSFESKYETALANCREDLNKWPISKPSP